MKTLFFSLIAILFCINCTFRDYNKAIIGTWEIDVEMPDSIELEVRRIFMANGTVETIYLGKTATKLKAESGPYASMFNDKKNRWDIKDNQLHIDPNGPNYECYGIINITKKKMRLIRLLDVLKSEITYKRLE